MLSHPNFDKPFEIRTDTSKLQLGSFISQNDKHIAFYSRTHNSAQVYCTTTEHDVISIELEKNLELQYYGNKFEYLQTASTKNLEQ